MSDQRSRGRSRARNKAADVPWLSREEVERRVDMRERDPDPGPEIGAPIEPAPTMAVAAPGIQSRRVDPRRVLWRDSAVILVVVVLALLGAPTFLPHDTGGPTDTAVPSGVVIGSLPPDSSPVPEATFPPIVDPSLGLDATPTPIPVITLVPR